MILQEIFDIAQTGKTVDKRVYGGKSYWLSWLNENNYNIPYSYYLPVCSVEQYLHLKDLLKSQSFLQLLEPFRTFSEKFEIAIRSSAIGEDSEDKSYAGHFKSFIGTFSQEQIVDNIELIIKSGKTITNDDNYRMGIVLQRKIDALYSGVAFSSNPLTASKNEILISTTVGMGENLVSGKISGEDILINYNYGKADIPLYHTQVEKHHILALCNISKDIERKLNIPVDIEWCVDSRDNQLYIVQCRPLTGIFPKKTGIIPITLQNELLIPYQVLNNDKVKIRLLAQQNKIDISNAYLVVNSNTSTLDEIGLSIIQAEERCKSFSVVLLFPKRVSGNIVRHFAQKESIRQQDAFRACLRYEVRSYQEYENLLEILRSVQAKCCELSWLCIAIIQEIFEPAFTGIIKKIEDGFLIEIAKGHFVPKGVVPTSQYVLNSDKHLIHKNEIIQDFAYYISNGEVFKQNINIPITIDNETLAEITKCFLPIVSNGQQAVEFGLLDNKEQQLLSPYLIDLVDDNSDVDLSSKLISEGVISMGIRRGKACFINISDLGSNSLELHFHNEIETKNIVDENIIFITDGPDIALLELLKCYNNDKIGFVFREGSALSHFSIILREKRIPAIIIKDKLNIQEMDEIEINAANENLNGNARLTKKMGCVTTYTNPDTDGICSAIAYSYYANALGKSFTPVYFGVLDNETIFVLRHYKFDLPKQIRTAKQYKEIVLVDTHHPAQLSDSIPLDRVFEIVDHHPSGSPQSFPNAKIQNEEIGAACTLIAERMQKVNYTPQAPLAGLMSLAIISNTLNFTAPSTSERDKNAFHWLSSLCEVSNAIILKMFEARSNTEGISSETLIENNIKEFVWGSKKVGVSQVEMTNVGNIVNRKDFGQSLINIKIKLSLDYIIFSGVNILEHTTSVYCPNQETLDIVNESMGFSSQEGLFIVNKILLRKTDFIPALKRYFER